MRKGRAVVQVAEVWMSVDPDQAVIASGGGVSSFEQRDRDGMIATERQRYLTGACLCKTLSNLCEKLLPIPLPDLRRAGP